MCRQTPATYQGYNSGSYSAAASYSQGGGGGGYGGYSQSAYDTGVSGDYSGAGYSSAPDSRSYAAPAADGSAYGSYKQREY